MRAFLAVEVPDLAPVAGLRPAPARAPRHFTLRFLGEVGEETLDRVDRAIGPVVARFAPFPLSVSGTGAFPDWDRPRIVYAEATEGRREFETIAAAVNDALDELGLPRDPRPFVPHVTLLRVRSTSDAARARELAGLARDRILSALEVDEVLLKESELLPSGARHRTVGRYPLGAPR